MNRTCRIYPLGDQGLTVDWGNHIDVEINRQVLNLYHRVRQAMWPGVRDLVPAYSSLTIHFDTGALLRQFPGQSPYDRMRQAVEKLLDDTGLQTEPPPGRLMRIPVCYDLSLAPDLESVAMRHGLPVTQLIDLHASTRYQVYILGFLPGFAYLGTVDTRIATPRLSRPRNRVPAGSVGIAGEQTGIYPLESPGGWNLIGRTPIRMFDAGRADPVFLRPGDQVHFDPVSIEQFYQLQAGS